MKQSRDYAILGNIFICYKILYLVGLGVLIGLFGCLSVITIVFITAGIPGWIAVMLIFTTIIIFFGLAFVFAYFFSFLNEMRTKRNIIYNDYLFIIDI